MANEFIARNGLIAQQSSVVTGSLTVTNGITGSLFGTATTASYVTGSIFTSANPALSASYALTASHVLNLQPASADFGGIVTTGTQTFAGAKTFNSPTEVPITALSVSEYAIFAATDNNVAIFAQSVNGGAVYGTTDNGIGVEGSSTTNYGIKGSSGGAAGGVFETNVGSNIAEFKAATVLKAYITSTGTTVANKSLINTTVDNGVDNLQVNGSATITGSLGVTAGITGSLFGTASFAVSSSRSISSSFAATASFANGYVLTSSTSSMSVLSSSYAITSSYALVAQTLLGSVVSASYAQTASFVTGSIFTSANPALSASYALTASFATTSSYINPLVQNVHITGSLNVTSNITATSAIARGANLTPTLVASANNDVLVGLDIIPTCINGAFTGVENYGIRVVDPNGYQIAFGHSSSSLSVIGNQSNGQLNIEANNGIIAFGNGGLYNIASINSAANATSDLPYTALSHTFRVSSPDTVVAKIMPSTGNLLLQSGGTFTDDGVNRLQISGSIIATSIKKSGGTSLQYLMADGSVTTGGGGGAAGLKTKSGGIVNSSFTGNPKKSTVTFSTAFADTNYSVTVTGEDARSWTIESKVAGSFIINTNSNTGLSGTTFWQAVAYGETA